MVWLDRGLARRVLILELTDGEAIVVRYVAGQAKRFLPGFACVPSSQSEAYFNLPAVCYAHGYTHEICRDESDNETKKKTEVALSKPLV
jgi:hypothetical protein